MTSGDAAMRRSAANAAAGRFLLRARESLGLTQGELGGRVGRELTGEPIGQSVWSHYEAGDRTVPGPVLVVVLGLVGRPVGAPLDEPVEESRIGRLERLAGAMAESLTIALERGTGEPATAADVARAKRAAREIRRLLEP